MRRRIDPASVGSGTDTKRVTTVGGLDATRTFREYLINLAYGMVDAPHDRRCLLVVEPTLRDERLQEEWDRAKTVFQPALLDRIGLVVRRGDRYIGIDRPVDRESERILDESLSSPRRARFPKPARFFEFVILKLLIHQFVTRGDPVRMKWLQEAAGCTYPTVAKVIRQHAVLIERTSDRRVALRWLPRQELSRLIAVAPDARNTMLFVDRSSQPRSAEAHLRRLRKLDPQGVAVGGVNGTRHYDPDLDLTGAPRLDLSIDEHHPARPEIGDLIQSLDPALERSDGTHERADVAVHVISHTPSLFRPRDGRLAWADPIECLFDLFEARLGPQASEFLTFLERRQVPP